MTALKTGLDCADPHAALTGYLMVLMLVSGPAQSPFPALERPRAQLGSVLSAQVWEGVAKGFRWALEGPQDLCESLWLFPGGETVVIRIVYWEDLPYQSLSLPGLVWSSRDYVEGRIERGGDCGSERRTHKLVGNGEERDLKEGRNHQSSPTSPPQPVLPSQPSSILPSETLSEPQSASL